MTTADPPTIEEARELWSTGPARLCELWPASVLEMADEAAERYERALDRAVGTGITRVVNQAAAIHRVLAEANPAWCAEERPKLLATYNPWWAVENGHVSLLTEHNPRWLEVHQPTLLPDYAERQRIKAESDMIHEGRSAELPVRY